MASAVKDIVIEINRSYTRDGCLELMSRHASKGARPLPAPLEALCVTVIRSDADDRRSLIEIRKIEAETKLTLAKSSVAQADERKERDAGESAAAPRLVVPLARERK